MKQSTYTRIGAFAFAAVLLGVAAVALMGGKKTSRKEALFETYIEETVQGIAAGSAVRYRGIPVGTVKTVSFAMARYQVPDDSPESRRATRYARVVFSVDVTDVPEPDKFTTMVERQVADGMRVHVKTQGITGLSYIDLDFDKSPPAAIPVPWTPDYPYIPTSPSLVKTLTDVFQNLSQEIHSFSQVKDSVTNLAARTSALAVTADAAVQKLEDGLDDVPALIAAATNAVADADALLRSFAPTADALPALVAEATNTVADIGALVRSFSPTADGLPSLVAGATGLVDRAGVELAALSPPLREAVANLGRAAEEIARLAEELRADPAKLIRGEEKETLE